MEHTHVEGKTEEQVILKAKSMRRRGFTADSKIIMVRNDAGIVTKYIQHFTRVKRGEENRFEFN